MDHAKVSVICPLRDANTGRWSEVEKILKKLPTLSKYYEFYPSSSYHIILQDLIEQKTSEGEWNLRLMEKREEWKKLNILLEERCKFSPRAQLSSMFFQETLGFILSFDGADTSLIKTIRHLVSSLSNTQYAEEVKFRLDLGRVIRTPPEKDDEDTTLLNAELKTLFKHLNDLFKIDNMIAATKEAHLTYFYNASTFIPWNGLIRESSKITVPSIEETIESIIEPLRTASFEDERKSENILKSSLEES